MYSRSYFRISESMTLQFLLTKLGCRLSFVVVYLRVVVASHATAIKLAARGD